MIPSIDLDSSFVLVDAQHEAKAANTLKSKEDTSINITKVEPKPSIEPESKLHPSMAPSYKPGSTTSYAHDWTGGRNIRVHGRHFVDAYGRVCQLRGVNLSGCCKTPVNHTPETFPDGHRSVTFVGRPFPLEEAHEHFSRLRRWGLSFLRFIVTWEAIEHDGPGQYDQSYLNYIRSLLSLLPQYGMVAFVSMHQDVWSRYSGGSGAPAWTLESVGFDLNALDETGAAWLNGVRKGGSHVDAAERGLWPTGYTKLAAATMATCFWGGDTFVPKLKVKNRAGQEVSIQEFLQGAFLDMFDKVVEAVGDLDSVIGFEAINEPHRGYIDLKSLHSFDYNVELHLGHIPSAFQSFQLGAGHPTLVPTYTRSFPLPTKQTSRTLLNTKGRKVWREDGPSHGKCPWEMHDVWGWDVKKNEGVVLRENYFARHPESNKSTDWYTDFYFPFLKRWAGRVRRLSSPDKIIFVEPIPNEFCPTSWTPEHQLDNMVYAPHWYDLNAVFSKAFRNFTVNVQGLSRGMFPLRAFYWGQQGARDNYSLQIRKIVEESLKSLGEKPVLIGECGVPMDLNNGEAFQTENFGWQSRMMDALMTGLDQALVGFTLWNYNPLNHDTLGDDWNGENFSWFSKRRALPPTLLNYTQDSPTLDNGARILETIVRPYPAKTAGIPLRFEYVTCGKFVFEWTTPAADENDANRKLAKGANGLIGVLNPPLADHPVLTSQETEIFIPSRLTRGRRVQVHGLAEGDRWAYDEGRQTLFVVVADRTGGKRHQIEVEVRPAPRAAFEVNDLWSDFGGQMLALGVVIAAICCIWLTSYWVKVV